MRTISGMLAALLAAAGLWTGAAAPVRADGPLEGKWLVQVLEGGQKVPIWLVQLKQADGKVTGEILEGRQVFNKAKLVEARMGDANSLHVKMDFMKQPLELAVYVTKKGTTGPEELVGTLKLKNQRALIKFSRAGDKQFDAKDVKADGKEGEELQKVLKNVRGLAQAVAVLKDFIKDHPKGRVTLETLRQLLQFGRGLDEQETVDVAKKAVNLAGEYGPEMKMTVLGEVILPLLRTDKGAALALEYAREAEKMLPETVSATERQTYLKLLADALKKNKQDEAASAVEAAAAKLNAKVDEEFEATNIPFEVKPFAQRKKGEDRTVVVELFTGAQCPPCVAADIAFDALAKRYKPGDVILLEYHLHIPGPDPMTNRDTEKRSDQYGVEGTPTAYVDGKVVPGLGGPWQGAEGSFQNLNETIKDKLQEKAQAKVKLAVERKGDDVELVATVADLPAADTKARLHLVVFQDVVRYAGGNGQRLHHHVVRAIPTGNKGISLKGKNGEFRKTFSLKELQASLAEDVKGRTFAGGSAPLDLHNLRVAAILQDSSSAEVLNAAQAAIPEK
jgi:hypothetical protein